MDGSEGSEHYFRVLSRRPGFQYLSRTHLSHDLLWLLEDHSHLVGGGEVEWRPLHEAVWHIDSGACAIAIVNARR